MDSGLHMIGLALRARRLEVGEEPVAAACRARDCRLLLLARDAADNTVRRAARFAEVGQCLTARLPWTKEELGEALGRTVCAIAAVTDVGFAGAIVGKLAQEDPERYSETAEKLAVKAKRAEERRREQKAHERNQRRGVRRKDR